MLVSRRATRRAAESLFQRYSALPLTPSASRFRHVCATPQPPTRAAASGPTAPAHHPSPLRKTPLYDALLPARCASGARSFSSSARGSLAPGTIVNDRGDLSRCESRRNLSAHGAAFRRMSTADMSPRGSERVVLLDRLQGDDDGIAVLTLNRPAARNAISRAMLAQLRGAMVEAVGEKAEAVGAERGGSHGGSATGADVAAPHIRALIVQSQVEGVFCSGADLKERRSMGVDEARGFVSALRRAFRQLELLPLPTIAAVEGAALGGGLELLLACDIRVAGNR